MCGKDIYLLNGDVYDPLPVELRVCFDPFYDTFNFGRHTVIGITLPNNNTYTVVLDNAGTGSVKQLMNDIGLVQKEWDNE